MDNFIVSARKYRPASFVSVVGQEHITSTLKNAISRNQLAHAYLFCGPRGVGKTTCARIFAKAINCLSPKDDEACNECESCRSFNEGRSFNIHELDAASNNSVDDIRSLTDQVRIPPQIGRYSVYIIDEVHMLSSAAFNAFLKTLEEPPAHAVFVLATTEKHKIIPTILSRCQIFDFNRIRVEDSVVYLKYIASQEGVAYDDESLHLIALKADGGMRDALSMFDKAVSFCGTALNFKEVAQTLNVLDYDTYFKITEYLINGEYTSVLTVFDDVLKKGFSPQIFISGLNSHFRDLLMSRDAATVALLEVGGALLERYRMQGQAADPLFLFEAIGIMTQTDNSLRTASNQRLNVELALMKISALSQKKNGNNHPFLANKDQGGEVVHSLPEPVKLNNIYTGKGSGQQADASSVGEVPSQPKTDLQAVKEISTSEPAAGAEQQNTPSVADSVSDQDSFKDVPISANDVTSHDTGSIFQLALEEAARQTHNTPPEHQQIAGERSADTQKKDTRADIHKLPQTISGTSIMSILDSSININEIGLDAEEAEVVGNVDPRSEEKVLNKKELFLEKLKELRPRIAVAMENMSVDGNVISFSVPSESLYEEIMRNSTELLTMLAEIASVDGRLELSVEVKEDNTVKKPIKAEDRLAFLAAQNPNLHLLRKTLGLDIE